MIVLVAAQPHRTGAPGQGPGQGQASSGGTGSFPGRLAIAQYLGRPGGGTSTGGSGSSEGGKDFSLGQTKQNVCVPTRTLR